MGNWFREPLENEISYDELKKKADNGEFHKWNFSPVMYQESGYEDVLDTLKQYQASDYLKLEERYKKLKEEGKEDEANAALKAMNDMVDDVLDIYRSKNIFPIQYYSELGVLDEIQRCISFDAKFDGDTVSCVTGDTEYFNGVEWRRIDEYKDGDRVLQFNSDGTASLVDPIKYIHYKSKDLFYIVDNATNIKLTANHNVIWIGEKDNKLRINTLEELFHIYTYDEPCDTDTKENIRTDCVKIPSGAVYDSDTCVTASKDVLMKTFWSIVQNDKEYMTEYTILDENGVVSLSDSCYILSLSSRLSLLKLFGIEEGEDLIGELRYITKKTMGVLSTLCSMSLYSTNLNYDWEYESYILDNYHMLGIYYPEIGTVYEEDKYCFTVPSHMLLLRSSNGNVFVTGNCGAGVGTGLCRWLFPNIFDTPSAHDLNKKDAETQYKKFLNDTYLRRAIRFCYSYKNGCPTPTAVEGGLRLVGSAPSNFRPMNAKAVYERFCPKGGTIFDYCCVDGSTEYFNGYKWKRIDKYEEGEGVLQYNEDGSANVVFPEEYIRYSSSDPFYLYESDRLSSALTGNHDVVIVENGKLDKIKQEKILNKNVQIPVSFIYDGSLDKSEEELFDMIDRVEPSDYSCYPINWYNLSYNSKCVFIEALKDTGCIYQEEDFEVYHGLDANLKFVDFVVHSTGYGITETYGSTLKIYKGRTTVEMNGMNCGYKKHQSTEKFCFVVPSHMLVLRRNGSIFVTGNCGFGGRMLGALTSKNNYRYVGTDPCTETMYHLHQLGEYIEQVTGREDSYELHCCGSEEFRGPANSIDFAFSSPPYFNLEVYSDELTQCFNKFPELDQWLEGFVRPTIQNIKYMLKPGRYYAVNIADFKVGSGQDVAYVDEWIRISTEEGMPLFDTVYLGVTARAGSAEQAAGELKKENILVFKKPLW